MSQKFSYEFVKDFLFSYGYILISEEYVDAHTPLTFSDFDGFLYKWDFGAIKGNIKANRFFPRMFTVNNPHSIYNIKKYVEMEDLPFDFYDGEWLGTHKSNLSFKCHNCGNVWKSSWSNLVNAKRGCPYCAGKIAHNQNSFVSSMNDSKLIHEWDYDKNYGVDIKLILPQSSKKVWWICSVCGHGWQAMVSSRNRPEVEKRTGCPLCRFGKKSKGESLIISFLNDFNMFFEYQKRFEGCRNINPLFYDFYIDSKNICVEYHGEQHYRPVNFGGMSNKKANKNYNITKERDLIKESFCKENNIGLLIIPYWERSNIEKILIKALNL
jgi:hypothetical protein